MKEKKSKPFGSDSHKRASAVISKYIRMIIHEWNDDLSVDNIYFR